MLNGLKTVIRTESWLAPKKRKDRGPGWRARLREAQAKKKEEAQLKREKRLRGRRRDRVSVRGRR